MSLHAWPAGANRPMWHGATTMSAWGYSDERLAWVPGTFQAIADNLQKQCGTDTPAILVKTAPFGRTS